MPPGSTGFAQASACESSNILQHCARNTQRAFRGRPQTIGKRRTTLQHQVPGGRELGGRRAKDHQSANRDRCRSTSHQKPRTFPAPLNRHSPHRSQSRHACSERCCEERRECGIPPEIAHLPPAARTARNTRSQRQAPPPPEAPQTRPPRADRRRRRRHVPTAAPPVRRRRVVPAGAANTTTQGPAPSRHGGRTPTGNGPCEPPNRLRTSSCKPFPQTSSNMELAKEGNAGLHQVQVHFDEVILEPARFCRRKDLRPIERALTNRHRFLGYRR